MEFVALITVLIFLLIVVIAVPAIFLLHLIGWTWTGVPYVPTAASVVKKLREAMPLSDNAVVYDLGCGDGRILYELAQHSNARFIGVEKAPLPFLAAKVRGFFARRPNVSIMFGDIFSTPLQNATHVYTYLLTPFMKKLEPKFARELKSGALLVSCDFRLPSREPELVLPAENASGHAVYRYRF